MFTFFSLIIFLYVFFYIYINIKQISPFYLRIKFIFIRLVIWGTDEIIQVRIFIYIVLFLVNRFINIVLVINFSVSARNTIHFIRKYHRLKNNLRIYKLIWMYIHLFIERLVYEIIKYSYVILYIILAKKQIKCLSNFLVIFFEFFNNLKQVFIFTLFYYIPSDKSELSVLSGA